MSDLHPTLAQEQDRINGEFGFRVACAYAVERACLDYRLGTLEHRIIAALSRVMDTTTRRACPSWDDLAALTGYSRDRVAKAIQALKTCGHIFTERRASVKGGHYIVHYGMMAVSGNAADDELTKAVRHYRASLPATKAEKVYSPLVHAIHEGRYGLARETFDPAISSPRAIPNQVKSDCLEVSYQVKSDHVSIPYQAKSDPVRPPNQVKSDRVSSAGQKPHRVKSDHVSDLTGSNLTRLDGLTRSNLATVVAVEEDNNKTTAAACKQPMDVSATIARGLSGDLFDAGQMGARVVGEVLMLRWQDGSEAGIPLATVTIHGKRLGVGRSEAIELALLVTNGWIADPWKPDRMASALAKGMRTQLALKVEHPSSARYRAPAPGVAYPSISTGNTWEDI